ncbi:MAG: hypothetical protein J6X67_11310 [Treponema sp.]|nr:hypothetical protein [Treponema sp.]
MPCLLFYYTRIDLKSRNVQEKLKRAVENYISIIYEKTGVGDRGELVLRYGQ